MELILSFDQQLFLLINNLPHTVFFNEIASFFSFVGTWGAVWFVIVLFLFLREEERDHWFFLPSAIVGFAAIMNEFVMKTIIARPRPTEILSGFSFPSTHALLAFAFAYILSREEPKLKKWFYFLATIISFSRIYLGVHYPLDVVVGALVGLGVGKITAKCAKMV